MNFKQLTQVIRILKLKKEKLSVLEDVLLYKGNAYITNIRTTFTFPWSIKEDMPAIVNAKHFASVNGDVEKQLKVIKRDEFPYFDKPGGQSCVFPLRQHELEILYDMLHFTGSDDLRPSMSHVNMLTRKGKLWVTATDAHKLYYKPLVSAKYKTDILISKDLINILKVFNPFEVIIRVHENYITASFQDIKVSIKRSDLKFPNVFSVIPDHKNEVIISRSSLMSAIKALKPFANTTTHQIVFDINKRRIKCSSENIDYELSKEVKLYFHSSRKTKPIKIGFNIRFLETALRVIKDDDIKFSYDTANRAGVFNNSLLIMPTMLNN